MREAFNEDYTSEIKNSIYQNVDYGIMAFNKFLQGNKKFLENADKCTLTRLLSHSVNTSLFDAAYTPEAVFKAEKLSTNGFGQSIVLITTPHFVSSTGKTNSIHELPNKANYKMKLAKGNHYGDGQYFFNFDNEEISDQPYYSNIIYGYNYRSMDCTHIALIVPAEKYKSILHTVPLEAPMHLDVVPDTVSENIGIKLLTEYENIIKKVE